MAASNPSLNPYRPSRIDETRRGLDLNPTASWIVSDVRKKLLYREIKLSGFLETTIAWDARGACEFIRVGDRKVVEKFCWVSAEHFEFRIPTKQAYIEGAIDVKIAFLLFTRKFRLMLNGQVIYDDSTC